MSAYIDSVSAYRSSRLRRTFFIMAYLAHGLNGTKAAVAAGYKASNARFYAARLLRNPKVRAELALRTKALFEGLRC